MVNILLFLAGLLVYAGYGIPGLIYLATAILLSYAAGLSARRFPIVTWVCIIANVTMLTLLRLRPITGLNLIAPLGVSYFTLQIISYNIDVYRGKYEPERNLFRYSLYVSFLPHLFIGPIERYDRMRPSLCAERRITWEGVADGSMRALWGLFKKYVIAARIAIIVTAISGDSAAFSGAYALVAMCLYSIQLYSDFSGGIDIVLGISGMLGFSLSENFDAPYLSQSVKEFWRRWHITLGDWLKDYVYIPLGGNRRGAVRKWFNLIVTFLVSGLWHGLEYLIWGLFHGVFVAFGTKLQTKWKTVNRIGTFLVVSLLWAFFIWPDASTAARMMVSVFTTFNYAACFTGILTMGLTAGDWIVLIAAVGALWIYDVYRMQMKTFISQRTPAGKTAIICTLALLVLVFGVYGIGFNAEAFIYSRF